MKRTLIALQLATVMLFSFLSGPGFGGLIIEDAGALQAPEQVHIAVTGDPSEMVITWVTFGATPTSTVEYGTSSGIYDYSASGSTHTYTDGGWVGEIHDVILTGLTPNTQYFYRVGDPSEGWSSEFRFTSAPSEFENVTFAAYADHGTSSAAQATSQNIQNDPSIDLIIHAGDLSYANGYQPDWDTWFNQIQDNAAHLPYMVVAGNHENDYNYSATRNRFNMPNLQSGSQNELYYSFNYSMIHFIAICSDIDYSIGGEQYNWLQSDLLAANQNREAQPWIVVFAHHPMYSSNDNHGSSTSFRNNMEPLLDQYNVDIAIWGHDHAYERTYPVVENMPSETGSGPYINPKETIHIVAGMAGKTLYTGWIDPQPMWSAYREADFGYVRITVTTDGYLHSEFIRNSDHTVRDEFWIEKNESALSEVRPYSDTSPWNTLLGPDPVIDPNSTIYIDSFGPETLSSDPTQYTYPIYKVTTATPLKTVYISGWYSNTVSETVLQNQGGGSVMVPIPDGAHEAAGSDAQIVIWNPETGDEWGFYHAYENLNGTWNVTNGFHYNTQYSAVPPSGFASRGAGVPYSAGLIRPWEIETGHIDHAIAFAFDYPGPNFVFPATKSDGKGVFPPDVPEGARLQLDPALSDADFDAWGLNSVAKIIARALQDYGMIVIDCAGRPKIYAEYEETANWNGTLVSNTVDGIPLSAFRVLALDGPYPGTPPPTEEINLISSGETWLYNETDPQPPSTPDWYKNGFDDSGWSVGWTAFGFGDSSSYGTELNDNDGGYYFRKTFSMDPGTEMMSATLKVASDNCAQVYLNGVLIDDDMGANHEYDYWNRVIEVPSSTFQTGINTIAVYVYNSPTSSDAYMDLELDAIIYANNLTFLKPGWNLISTPKIQSNQNMVNVLENIDGYYDAVQMYDQNDITDPWKHYNIGKGFGNDLYELNETIGFWVHITEPAGISFECSGVEPTENQAISLHLGWNLVGYPSLSSYSRENGLNNLVFGVDVNCIQWYDAGTQMWYDMGPSDDFVPGMGYWMHSNFEATWDVPL
jgi:predicted phosphodiesterase